MSFKKLQKVLFITIFIIMISFFIPHELKAQSACTPEEVNLIVTAYQLYMAAFVSLDLNRMNMIDQEVEQRLSIRCKNALIAASMQQAPHSPPSPHPGASIGGRVPGVLDHGGGTYSIPGVGGCGPSGCWSN